MKFSQATIEDLEQLKNMYNEIVNDMYSNNLEVWDNVYPMVYFKDDIEIENLYLLKDGGTIVLLLHY